MKKLTLTFLTTVLFFSCSQDDEVSTVNNTTDNCTTIVGKTYSYRTEQDCEPMTFCQNYYPITFGDSTVGITQLDMGLIFDYTKDNNTITVKHYNSDYLYETFILNENCTILSDGSRDYYLETK